MDGHVSSLTNRDLHAALQDFQDQQQQQLPSTTAASRAPTHVPLPSLLARSPHLARLMCQVGPNHSAYASVQPDEELAGLMPLLDALSPTSFGHVRVLELAQGAQSRTWQLLSSLPHKLEAVLPRLQVRSP